jgi:hypothetical protein
MRILTVLVGLLCSASLSAQTEYETGNDPGAASRPFQFGLYGFSARLGVDFEDQGQAVASFAVDMGDLFTDRLRFRPSAELGFGWGENTYVANVEVIYRFTSDATVAVPYVGGGLALSGQEGCAQIDECPAFWAQFALGFEVRLQNQINWLLEYHAEDAFKRHRVLLGLTTRRGS